MPLHKRLLVRLYPRAWRRRYGEEFALLLDATPITVRVVANVLGAAGREWLLRTAVGRCALAMSVAWVANVIATHLSGAFPVEASIEFAGLRWAPWPSYFGLAEGLLLFGVCFRLHAVIKRNGAPIGSAEFGYWIVGFLVASIGSQWGDMVSDRDLTYFEIWKTNAIMLSGQFLFLLIASKRPEVTTSTTTSAVK